MPYEEYNKQKTLLRPEWKHFSEKIQFFVFSKLKKLI